MSEFATKKSDRRATRSRALFVLLTIVLLLPIAGGTLARALAQSKGEDSFYKEVAIFSEVLSLIQRGYVDETEVAGLFAGAFDGAADALDPLATFVPGDAVEGYRQALAVGNSRSGLSLARDRGVLYVVGAEPGSPAEATGLRSGDILSELDGRSTRLVPLWRAQTAFAQEPGTKIALEWLRQGQKHEAEIVLADYESAEPSIVEKRGVGVLALPDFDSATSSTLEELLPGQTGSAGLVIDLRGVAGGAPEAAIAAADLFVDGVLARLERRGETLEVYESQRRALWSGEVVLLTDRGSQGASELFAAILSEGVGARRVGMGTFGHSGRGTTRELSEGSSIFYTDAFYTTTSGTPLNETLSADVQVRSRGRLVDSEAEVEDPVLERALELVLEAANEARKAA